jgi:hypothetical protein
MSVLDDLAAALDPPDNRRIRAGERVHPPGGV